MAIKDIIIFAIPNAEPDTTESSQPEEALSSEAHTEGNGNGVTYEAGETVEAESSELKSPSSSDADIMSSRDDVSIDSDFEKRVAGSILGTPSGIAKTVVAASWTTSVLMDMSFGPVWSVNARRWTICVLAVKRYAKAVVWK